MQLNSTLFYRKNGGSLQEREYLEKLKYYHKTELLKLKEFYKSLIENNKLLQKTISRLLQ
jgi:hypothetical protein